MLGQYDRERFDPVTLASVAAFHTRQVAAAFHTRQVAAATYHWMIADAARTMALSRTVVLRCRPEVAAGFARLAWRPRPGSGW